MTNPVPAQYSAHPLNNSMRRAAALVVSAASFFVASQLQARQLDANITFSTSATWYLIGTNHAKSDRLIFRRFSEMAFKDGHTDPSLINTMLYVCRPQKSSHDNYLTLHPAPELQSTTIATGNVERKISIRIKTFQGQSTIFGTTKNGEVHIDLKNLKYAQAQSNTNSQMTSYIDITRIVDEPAQHYAFSRDGQHFSFDKDIMQIVTFHRNTPIGRRVKFDEDIEKILKRFNRIKTRQYTTYSTSEMIARCEKHRSTNVSSNSHDEPSRTSKSRQQHSPQTRALQALSKTSNLRAHNVAALLRGNICNAPAMTEAVLLLNGQQMFQHSIALGTTFLKRCSSSYSIAFPVAYAMYHSSRLEDAARLLREYEPVKRDNSQYYTWRGFVDERLGRHTTAARHFLKALTLFPDLKNVHVQQFYYATRALEAAGKPCEAMHPLQMYVALEPAKRMTGQIRSILNRLRQRGRC